jgi:predicted RNase H-like HicB family nuclease
MDRNLRERVYYVRADWDGDAGVWYVSGTDIPGLAAEAETPEALRTLLDELIPELVALNGGDGDAGVSYSLTFDRLRAKRPVA